MSVRICCQASYLTAFFNLKIRTLLNLMCIYNKDYNIYTSALKKARQKAGFFI